MDEAMQILPEGEFSIDEDEFGKIVRLNVKKLKDLSKVPGVKRVYPTDADPDQPAKHHGVISNMKDINGDGNIHVFRALIDKPYTRIACFDESGWQVWISEKIAPGGDDESGMQVVDIDGDGRCDVVYDHDGCGGAGPLYVADAVTGGLKYVIDYAKQGLSHCQGFTMDNFCPERPGLEIAVVGKDHRLLLFDNTGELLWQRRVHTGLVTRADWNGDGVKEILVFAVGYWLDPAWSVWNGKGERLFAMSFLPAPQRCHASMCGPGLGFDGFDDLDGNGKADVLVAYGPWKTGEPQYQFIAEAPGEW